MPIKTLALNELIMLLALDDDDGRVRWSISPFLDYALAGAMLAELLLRGRLKLNESGGLELDGPDEPTGSALLEEVVAHFKNTDVPHTVAGCVTVISTLPDLSHRQTEELVAKGILGKKEGHFLLIFPVTVYPMLDTTPEKEVVSRIRECVLGNDPVEPRMAVLITIAHGAHLLREALTDDELDERQGRLREIAQTRPVAAATCELIQQTERALYVASSIPFLGGSRL